MDKEERKKEKKERKREKEKVNSIQNIEVTNKRKRDADGLDQLMKKSLVNSKEVDSQNKNVTEAEELERSSLSEEHGQPVLTESFSCDSDGTQSQSKTKRTKMEQSTSCGICTPQGNSVRFRLKRREQETVHATDDVPSTSGRTGTPVATMFDALHVSEEPCLDSVLSSAEGSVLVEQLSLGRTGAAHGSNDILPLCNSSLSKGQKKPQSAYKALFSNWIPPSIHYETVPGKDYEQWMFPSKKQPAQKQLRLKSLNGESGISCSSSWPRAHLFPESDLYVLPFTVPL